ncbi:MAG: MoaD/ThiS family protein [Nanoarchaeota archaeon]
MRITIERTGEVIERAFEGTISSLLLELGIKAETTVAVKNKQIVTDDEKVGGEDEVQILSVISGG